MIIKINDDIKEIGSIDECCEGLILEESLANNEFQLRPQHSPKNIDLNDNYIYNETHTQSKLILRPSALSNRINTAQPSFSSNALYDNQMPYLNTSHYNCFPEVSSKSARVENKKNSQNSQNSSNQKSQRKHHSSQTNLSQEESLMNLQFLVDLEKIIEKQFSPLVIKIMETLQKNENRMAEKEIQDNIQSEWSDCALVADHFFCYFFPIMTLLTCFFIFFKSPYFKNMAIDILF